MKKLLTIVSFVAIMTVSNEARGTGWNSLQSEMFFAGCSDECLDSSKEVGGIVNVKEYCECFCHDILHFTDSFHQANMFIQDALDNVPVARKEFDRMMYQCFIVNQKGKEV